MIFRASFFIVCIFLVISNGYTNDYSEIGSPLSKVYAPFNQYGEAQNWHIIEGKDGLIYVGSHNGLSVWDGETWSQYTTPHNSRVRSLTYWNDDRIYVGITNDIGYFEKNNTGHLQYHSLIDHWDDKKSKFGSVWSVAAINDGVLFSSRDSLIFWDGKEVQIIDNTKKGSHKLFGINGVVYYKHVSENLLSKIIFNHGIQIEKTTFDLPKNSVIKQIIVNKNNQLMVFTATHGVFQQQDMSLVRIDDENNFPENIKISSALQTPDHFYFVLSKYQGLFVLDANFKTVKQYNDEDILGTNVMFNMIQDKNDYIWLVGEPSITQLMPPHYLSYYQTEFKSKVTENMKLIANQVTVVGDSAYQLQSGTTFDQAAVFKHIASDRNKMWDLIRYKDYALFSGINGIYAARINSSNELFNFKKVLDMPFSANMVLNPSKDKVFVVTDNGLYSFALHENQRGDNNQDSQWQAQHFSQIDDDLQYVFFDKTQSLWVTTSKQSVYKIRNLENNRPLLIDKYGQQDGIPINSFKPFLLSRGLVFASSIGLMDFDENRTPHFQLVKDYPPVFTDEKQAINLIYEHNNNYWYSTDEHIGYAKLTDTRQWQVNEKTFNSIPNGGYRAFVKSNENTLWVSMYNGDIYRLNTSKFDSLPSEPNLNIRKITNKNTNETLFGGFGSVDLGLLSSHENTLRIHYALSDTGLNKNTSYRYRLLGLNQQWSQWRSENYTDFTSLQGDSYTFQLEAKDKYDRIYQSQFAFDIKPLWYLSTLAKSFYLVAIILLLMITAWLAQKWRTKKLTEHNLELQRLVNEKTSELVNQQAQKDRFFANVSHEFRTPLTLTIAPLKSVIDENPKLPKNISHSITTAIRNANKMLSLVGQILDINRLESGKFPLRIAEYNATDLMSNIVQRFQSWSEQNHQELVAINLQEPVLLYYDQDQIDKCLSNLVSNAIKYSGNNSKIEVEIIHKGDQVGLRIADNGKGINPEFEDKIFERYFQDVNSEQVSHPGTGIGLALVKELTELHHGKLELDNNYPSGCQFILWLKKGKNHFDQSSFIESLILRSVDQYETPPQIENTIDHHIENETTILVVDDNVELLDFISSKLSDNFNILRATDGNKGLTVATTHLPDLIVSDVMMPVMDGYEMTRKLKNQEVTKLIPVILLTAKSQKRDVVEGLNTGADDYLSKPFDTPELIARISGILNNRKLIRETIQYELSQQATNIKSNNTFINSINDCLLENISNPNLNAKYLATLMSMSRQTLNRKCNKAFELSTIQYIKQTRMQHAYNLIKSGKHNISEVAYGTGYESLAYFSNLFKKQFGQSPTQVRK